MATLRLHRPLSATHLFCFFFIVLLAQGEAGKFVKFDYAGHNNMLYVPSKASKNASLIVMLHGCVQTAVDFADGTRMNAAAELFDAYVLYPEQNILDNVNRCWNWFLPFNQQRNYGEPHYIASVTRHVMEQFYDIDHTKVFMGGLSAGGAMATIMAATYPDLYSGIAVSSGLEFKAAITVPDAFLAMSFGGPNPVDQGKLAFKEMGDKARAIPTFVAHGDYDQTVAHINGLQVAQSMAVVSSLAEVPGLPSLPTNSTFSKVPGGRDYEIHDYSYDNKVYVRHVVVKGMGHAWSGGSHGASYTDPSGPNITMMAVKFWLEQTRNAKTL